MKLRTLGSLVPALMIVLITILACTFGQARPSSNTAVPPVQPISQTEPTLTATVAAEQPSQTPVTPLATVAHLMKPAAAVPTGKIVNDTESEGTAPEQRAPYGDSYNINRFERPFLQGMVYNSNLDLSTYSVSSDTDWYYVSISIVGNDPNDKLGIDYAVELDTDHDGYGDYIIWAQPPYPLNWDTAAVKIFRDTNHDTGGLSAEKSDAPLKGNGYDTLIFNGGPGDADPDLAWIRVNNGMQGLVQFAFKRSWSGNVFMLGVMSDAGLKDPGQLDYVDRITAADAGSPVRDNQYYPLKALVAVDNVCRTAFGFKPTGYEPQLCPMEEPAPKRTPKPGVTVPPPTGCQPPITGCPYGWAGEPFCYCIPG